MKKECDYKSKPMKKEKKKEMSHVPEKKIKEHEKMKKKKK